MGATPSKKKIEEEKKQGIADFLDRVFTDVINSSDFKILKDAIQEQNCNEILTTTTEILMKFFNFSELEVIQKRIENGLEEKEITNEPIMYATNRSIKKIKNKQRLCEGIAKFYVKIYNLFFSIVKIVNPIYIYNDEYGQEQKVSIMDKTKEIVERKGKIVIDNNKNNFTKRILDLEKMTNDNTIMKCYDDKNLVDITGIQRLKYLYYDIFNKETGKFDKMSEESKKQYQNDVNEFYKAYTGKTEVPENIKNFSDIRINDCEVRKSSKPIKKDNNVISSIASNTKKLNNLIQQAYDNFQIVLSDIFVYNQKRDLLVINPKLNYKLLNNLIDETRKMIVNLYIESEKIYNDTLKLMEAFVEIKTEQRERQVGFRPGGFPFEREERFGFGERPEFGLGFNRYIED